MSLTIDNTDFRCNDISTYLDNVNALTQPSLTKQVALDCLSKISMVFDSFKKLEPRKHLVSTLKKNISVAKRLNTMFPLIEILYKISEMEMRLKEIYRNSPKGEIHFLREKLDEVRESYNSCTKSYKTPYGKYCHTLKVNDNFTFSFIHFLDLSFKGLFSSVGGEKNISNFYGFNENRMFSTIELSSSRKKLNYQKIMTIATAIARFISINYQNWGIAGAKIGHFRSLKLSTNNSDIDVTRQAHYIIFYHQTKEERRIYDEEIIRNQPCSPIPITIDIDSRLKLLDPIKKKSLSTRFKIKAVSLANKIKSFFINLFKILFCRTNNRVNH